MNHNPRFKEGKCIFLRKKKKLVKNLFHLFFSSLFDEVWMLTNNPLFIQNFTCFVFAFYFCGNKIEKRLLENHWATKLLRECLYAHKTENNNWYLIWWWWVTHCIYDFYWNFHSEFFFMFVSTLDCQSKKCIPLYFIITFWTSSDRLQCSMLLNSFYLSLIHTQQISFLPEQKINFFWFIVIGICLNRFFRFFFYTCHVSMIPQMSEQKKSIKIRRIKHVLRLCIYLIKY